MMPETTDPWLAFDIGGANLKAAHSDGSAVSFPFELWKRPDDLAGSLGRPGRSLAHRCRPGLSP